MVTLQNQGKIIIKAQSEEGSSLKGGHGHRDKRRQKRLIAKDPALGRVLGSIIFDNLHASSVFLKCFLIK